MRQWWYVVIWFGLSIMAGVAMPVADLPWWRISLYNLPVAAGGVVMALALGLVRWNRSN